MRLFTFILTASWLCLAEAKDNLPSARIVDYGIYLTNVTGTASAADTTTGEISLLSAPRLVRSTSTIPALPKSSFGLRYQLVGVSSGDAVAVTDVIITPGIKDPDSDEDPRFRESREDIAFGGRTNYTGYTFDSAWEAVPGTWTIEIWHKDSQLLSQEFRVVPAKPLRN
ncbi:MAG: DUF3859 domain-containing protein [Gammaproteobacteria bacterium]|jgi:hypothetical protein|nr:DUF3859 domain-containing protein [Gammaproteobacteria bacterium]MBT4494208.1 DUF3859 domain-containing protein [Gammaproteobacteria bacterium]MBT7369250.1 DUF3859 domain-containing protein [Gammaproteobacteria bacterium]